MRLLRPSARVHPGSTKRNRRRRRSEMSDRQRQVRSRDIHGPGPGQSGGRSPPETPHCYWPRCRSSPAVVWQTREQTRAFHGGDVQSRRAGLVVSPIRVRLAKGDPHKLILGATVYRGMPRLRLRRAEPPARLRRHVHDPVRSLTPPPVPHRHLKTRQFVRSKSRSRRTTSRETRSSR